MEILRVLLLIFSAHFYKIAAETKNYTNNPNPAFEDWTEKPKDGCECMPRPDRNDACCDSRSCKLFPNATCAAGNCCNLKTCQLKTIGIVCRHPETACDLPEFCDGLSQDCPPDVYKFDMHSCRQSDFCYDGNCYSNIEIGLTPLVTCPNQCSGNGVCNNLGHCHCHVGFSGEACDQDGGAGGSVDSGPASNPNFMEVSFQKYTYIAFCAAIPLVVLFNLLVCVCCRNFDCPNIFNRPKRYRGSQMHLCKNQI